MIIDNNTLTSIRESLNKLSTDPSASDVEVEARFGLFLREFVSGISRNTFVRLHELLRNNNFPSTFNHTKDEFFGEDRWTIVYEADGTISHIYHNSKTNKKNFDIPRYFTRISISKETTDNKPKPNLEPTLIRDKKRYSYILDDNDFKLDLTEVTSYSKANTKTIYEAELELIKDKRLNLDKFNLILEIVLKIILNTTLLYDMYEKEDVINNINSYLGSRNIGTIDYNLLSQPRNFKATDLVYGGLIQGQNGIKYTISIKADGLRKLLVIDPNGIYLVMAPTDIDKIYDADEASKLTDWYGTIIEGELIPTDKIKNPEYKKYAYYFLMYDCLSLCGNPDIRKEDYLIRWNITTLVETLFNENNSIKFVSKKFDIIDDVHNFYRFVNIYLDNKYEFETDGLIFTPLNCPYDTGTRNLKLESRILTLYPDICKWKPLDKLTIDFEIQHSWNQNNEPTINLMANEKNQVVKFVGTKIHPFDPNINLDRDQLAIYPNGTIIEFKWENNKFVYQRVRYDKPKANDISIAIDNWNVIHSSIDEDTIRGRKFSLINRYHNRIKTELLKIPMNTKNIKSILDIGSGRGGDVQKWVKAGYTHIVCVEPNDKHRVELKNRLDKYGIKNYLIIPTIGQDIDEIIKQVNNFIPGGKVDTIAYMLSLSFLSENEIDSVVKLTDLLLPNGNLVFLSIDGKYVREFFNDTKNFIEYESIRKAYFTLIDFWMLNDKKIYINIPNSIVEKQEEYITDIDKLVDKLTNNGMKLVSRKRTNDEKFLSSEELIFSSFFTSVVMQK